MDEKVTEPVVLYADPRVLDEQHDTVEEVLDHNDNLWGVHNFLGSILAELQEGNSVVIRPINIINANVDDE